MFSSGLRNYTQAGEQEVSFSFSIHNRLKFQYAGRTMLTRMSLREVPEYHHGIVQVYTRCVSESSADSTTDLF